MAPIFAIFACLSLPAGGMIEDVDKKVVELREDTAVEVNEQTIILKKGTAAEFYNTEDPDRQLLYKGRLASGCNLRNTILSVQGKEVAFKAGRVFYLAFYPNGGLKIGFLAEDTELDQEGKPATVPAGYSVEFTEEGELRYAKPESPG